MVWIESKSELRQFIDEINQKHQPIKFDSNFEKKVIEFLDTLVYINSNNRLQTTLYKNQLTVKTIYVLNWHTHSPYS